MFKLIRKEFTVATIKNYLEKVRLCSLPIRPVFYGLTVRLDYQQRLIIDSQKKMNRVRKRKLVEC